MKFWSQTLAWSKKYWHKYGPKCFVIIPHIFWTQAYIIVMVCFLKVPPGTSNSNKNLHLTQWCLFKPCTTRDRSFFLVFHGTICLNYWENKVSPHVFQVRIKMPNVTLSVEMGSYYDICVVSMLLATCTIYSTRLKCSTHITHCSD